MEQYPKVVGAMRRYNILRKIEWQNRTQTINIYFAYCALLCHAKLTFAAQANGNKKKHGLAVVLDGVRRE